MKSSTWHTASHAGERGVDGAVDEVGEAHEPAAWPGAAGADGVHLPEVRQDGKGGQGHSPFTDFTGIHNA